MTGLVSGAVQSAVSLAAGAFTKLPVGVSAAPMASTAAAADEMGITGSPVPPVTPGEAGPSARPIDPAALVVPPAGRVVARLIPGATAAFFRARFVCAAGRPKRVSGETGIPDETVRKCLSGSELAPENFGRALAAYGPAFIVHVFDPPPAWAIAAHQAAVP